MKSINFLFSQKLNPCVKKLLYSDVSGEGAINLAAICWLTSIFYESIKLSMHHPGFLMIDSVQSGIGVGDNIDSDFRDQKLYMGCINCFMKWVIRVMNAQLIAVDNHPPPYMKNDVIVYYSGKADVPPYGFIDDETG